MSTSIFKRPLDGLLLLLFCYFILMNVTIETTYCAKTLEVAAEEGKFLAQTTIDFCIDANPLFLLRPEWLRVATCVSAHLLVLFYLFFFVVFLFGINSLAKIALYLLGFKTNAIFFYWLMEFTSDIPPPSFVKYVAAEGPYVYAILYIFFRLAFTDQPFGREKAKVQ